MKTNLITWILAVFGAITFLPLLAAQLMMILKPNHQKTKDLIIAKGADWRDKTHFRSALAFAWADLLVLFPLLIVGTVAVLTGHTWGFILWFALGILSIYFSILFWIMEKEYALPSCGWFAYFTFFWGFFLYWGIAVTIYSSIQLNAVL